MVLKLCTIIGFKHKAPVHVTKLGDLSLCQLLDVVDCGYVGYIIEDWLLRL
jgi:hypothetical protein